MQSDEIDGEKRTWRKRGGKTKSKWLEQHDWDMELVNLNWVGKYYQLPVKDRSKLKSH